MAWELYPPPTVESELQQMGEIELQSMLSEVKSWIQEGEWDDLAIARAIIDRGHSEDFSYWLLKEARMRDIEEHKPSDG